MNTDLESVVSMLIPLKLLLSNFENKISKEIFE